MYDPDDVAGVIVDAAYHLHREVGPGLLESAYREILADELVRRGLPVERERPVPLTYRGRRYDLVYRADLIVAEAVAVELKAREQLAAVHTRQLFTYLKMLDLRVGLLINFGAPLMRDGIKRVVNGYLPSSHSTLRVNQR
jgi:iron complex transport system substrate-binding protein